MTTTQKPKHQGVSVLSSQFTVTVSVALVLLLLGLAALLGIGAHNATESLKSKVGFVAILSDTATPAEINGLKRQWVRSPFAASVKYSSADDVLKRWQAMNPDSESEEALLGVNPFFAEFEVTVKGQYANTDSLTRIVEELKRVPAVRHVRMHAEMVDSLNSSIRLITLILTAIAAVMLLIATVLIVNTVRLTIYSRRFTIRTMQLVGATDGFIRRPIIIASALQGLIAAMIATVIICGILYSSARLYPEIVATPSWLDAMWVCCGLVVTGIAVCSFAALIATNKYLHADFDDMYK